MERSKYLGVYFNRYEPTRDAFPFRAAIKQYTNDGVKFKDLGFFRSEEAAAHVYNVNALVMFGKGAIINDIDMTRDIAVELEEYMSKRRWFKELLSEAAATLQEHGTHLMKNANKYPDE